MANLPAIERALEGFAEAVSSRASLRAAYLLDSAEDAAAEVERTKQTLLALIAEVVEENARLREALTEVLASAFPHPTEQPAMYAAWLNGQNALRAKEAKHG